MGRRSGQGLTADNPGPVRAGSSPSCGERLLRDPEQVAGLLWVCFLYNDGIDPGGPSNLLSWESGAGAMEVDHRRFYGRLLCPQVVGNLLYYRFLNPAVVAPDAFDIVAMAAGGALAAPQRHALGAVAQVLQHAAAGKAFSRESQHLRVLNDYLEETHLKFRSRSRLPVPLRFLLLLLFLSSFHKPLPFTHNSLSQICEEGRHRG